jgi:nitric oxide dioxygenase
MIPDARRLLLETWPATDAEEDALATRFYARLFELDPGTSALFASTDMVAQRRKLMDMLRWMLQALDTPEHLVPGTAHLARRHVQYGVVERHYDLVGEALRDALADTLGARCTPAVRDAWIEAYALLAGVMLRAVRPSI